jgi:hypothetical protein
MGLGGGKAQFASPTSNIENRSPDINVTLTPNFISRDNISRSSSVIAERESIKVIDRTSANDTVINPNLGSSEPCGSMVNELESTLDTTPSNMPPMQRSFRRQHTWEFSSFHFLNTLNASSIEDGTFHLHALAFGKAVAEALERLNYKSIFPTTCA